MLLFHWWLKRNTGVRSAFCCETVVGHTTLKNKSSSVSQADKSDGLITLFLSHTHLHSHARTQSTHSFNRHDTVATLFPTSKNLSGKCDCKIIILVYTPPGSPLFIFMILKDKVCSSRRAGLIHLPKPFGFHLQHYGECRFDPASLGQRLYWTWSALKRINTCYCGLGWLKK